MCGIVGYTGANEAVPVLISGLEKLEYRGYDSAGVAVRAGSAINVVKTRGRLSALKALISETGERLGKSNTGIGHTRWATHGEPNDVNSHPHLSRSEQFAVVHNGIIENYMPLKERLIRKGFAFQSETDTEVVANLVEYYYKGDMVETLSKVMSKIEGSYALGVLSVEHPDMIFAARKDSPLVIARCEAGSFMASDLPALLPYTRDFFELAEGEIAVLSPESVVFYDEDRETVEKTAFRVDWDENAAELNGFPHFMLKEIYEQPKALRDTVTTKIKDGEINFGNKKGDFRYTKEQVQSIDKLYIIACGSAYHAAIVGKRVIESLTRLGVAAELASEFRYADPVLTENTLVVVVSQSGETLDSLMALKYAKSRGAKTLAVVNVLGSAIAKAADYRVYTNAGPEIAVATTKAYSCQLAVLYALAIYLGRKLETVDDERNAALIGALSGLSCQVGRLLDDAADIQYLASRHYNERDVFFIGRGSDYAAALEASLKLKEISYIHSEAYAAGELKHGAIALIERNTLVVAVAVSKRLFDKTASNMAEVKSRGAFVAALTWEGNDKATVADHTMYVPETDELFSASLTIIPLQLFAYYVANMKGLDVDKPRNLAKSVTVE